MPSDKKLLSACGLYCGVCPIRYADRENLPALKEKLAGIYGITADQVACEGCRSEKVFVYCRVCSIASCARERGLEGCHECGDFPCERLAQFPNDVGRAVMLRAVPKRKELGDEAWVEEELARYRCLFCGAQLYRGASRCRKCKAPVLFE